MPFWKVTWTGITTKTDLVEADSKGAAITKWQHLLNRTMIPAADLTIEPDETHIECFSIDESEAVDDEMLTLAEEDIYKHGAMSFLVALVSSNQNLTDYLHDHYQEEAIKAKIAAYNEEDA